MADVTETKLLNTKLNRITLVEQVAEGLMQLIEANKLEPGDSLLSTTSLVSHFGVSRPVVREALKLLEAKGVIEVANGKKPTVKPISTEPLLGFFDRIVKIEHEAALKEFMEVRQGLEIQSARLAAERRKPEHVEQLKEIVQAMGQNLDDFEAFVELDVGVHLLIAEASHNTMLLRLIKSIRETLRTTVWEGYRRRTKAQIEYTQQLHETIVAGIEEGDPEKAGEAMANHFKDAIFLIWGV
jgi:DNA-binding FadR family transcriptional regulator